MNGVVINENTHASLIQGERRDPITKSSFKAGDQVIACANCNIIYTVHSWSLINSRCLSCNGANTSENIDVSSDEIILNFSPNSHASPLNQTIEVPDDDSNGIFAIIEELEEPQYDLNRPFTIIEEPETPQYDLNRSFVIIEEPKIPQDDSNKIFQFVDSDSVEREESQHHSNDSFIVIDEIAHETQPEQPQSGQTQNSSATSQASGVNQVQSQSFWKIIGKLLEAVCIFHRWIVEVLLDAIDDLNRISPKWELEYIYPLLKLLFTISYIVIVSILIISLFF